MVLPSRANQVIIRSGKRYVMLPLVFGANQSVSQRQVLHLHIGFTYKIRSRRIWYMPATVVPCFDLEFLIFWSIWCYVWEVHVPFENTKSVPGIKLCIISVWHESGVYIDGLLQEILNSIALLTHWSYVFLALTHWYADSRTCDMRPSYHKTNQQMIL